VCLKEGRVRTRITAHVPEILATRIDEMARAERRSRSAMIELILSKGMGVETRPAPTPAVVSPARPDEPTREKEQAPRPGASKCTMNTPRGTKCKFCGNVH
jgi:hypothetical protein